ncbi:MAG: hypothetical protein AB7V16_00860 [Vulcanibacillus sp.]
MLWLINAASLIFSVLGILYKNVYLAIYGVVLALPLVIYLSGTPKFSIYILALPLFQCASVYYIYRKNFRYAWLLLLPFVALSVYLIVIAFFG